MSDKLPPIHPGEVLMEDFLKPMGLSQSKLAIALRVPLQRVHDIVHGRRAITVDTAVRLSRYFGNSVQFWVNLQAHYDIEMARFEGVFEQVANDVRPMEGQTQAHV